MISAVHKAINKDGKLTFVNEDRFSKCLLGLKEEVEVVIRNPRKDRSLQENSYYWGVVLEILSKDIGYTPEEMHEIMKKMFLSRKAFLRCSKGLMEVSIIQSTTKLSTVEMEEYLDKIRAWAGAEMNIFVPLPNEIEVTG